MTRSEYASAFAEWVALQDWFYSGGDRWYCTGKPYEITTKGLLKKFDKFLANPKAVVLRAQDRKEYIKQTKIIDNE